MGHFTGLSTSAYALGPLPLSAAHHPQLGEFGWTIALALAVGVVTSFLMRGGLSTYRFVSRRQLLMLLPAIGLVIGGLAIAFSQITDKSTGEVLFSGQDQLPGLVGNAGTWSLAALAWLLVFKGLAYCLSLGSYRGGPTFPALFLGAAAGIMASHLPGFPIQAAVAVGMGAAVVAVLRLPLSAVVLATLLTTEAGSGRATPTRPDARARPKLPPLTVPVAEPSRSPIFLRLWWPQVAITDGPGSSPASSER